MPSELRKKPQIACLHPYLENRRKEIEQEVYPRNHLWGLEQIELEEDWTNTIISASSVSMPSLVEKMLNQVFFRGSPGVKAEIAALRSSHTTDLIYSVCGPLNLVRLFKKAKLVSWVFREPPRLRKGLHLAHAAYLAKNLRAHSGFLCLTPKAEKKFAQFAPSLFLPWYVDLKLFNGKCEGTNGSPPFFLATGKTERDYQTLVKAAKEVSTDVRIIGPSYLCPKNLSSNVHWINTSDDPPDKAIDYPTLRNWYAQCIGVCIPLTGDAEDTCGYTNLLESMAMAKPVLMTKSGCLAVDPEREGYGFWVRPKDPTDWSNKMNLLANDRELSKKLGSKGRALAEKHFSPKDFNEKLVQFLKEIIR